MARRGSVCVWCGRDFGRFPNDLSAEHLCPRSKGGTFGEANIEIACRRCNRARRSRSAVAYAVERESEGLAPRWDVLERDLRALASDGVRREREYARTQLRHLPEG
ncbi:HNH endonuclease [Thermoleophilia bacterium SCSIO 60948]|nr:HNH endonuclease [Thermoleophilia bacterium SCSIO 60948]